METLIIYTVSSHMTKKSLEVSQLKIYPKWWEVITVLIALLFSIEHSETRHPHYIELTFTFRNEFSSSSFFRMFSARKRKVIFAQRAGEVAERSRYSNESQEAGLCLSLATFYSCAFKQGVWPHQGSYPEVEPAFFLLPSQESWKDQIKRIFVNVFLIPQIIL